MSDYKIKLLRSEDWRLFRQMRIEMAKFHPDCVFECEESAKAKPDSHWQNMIGNPLNALFVLLYNTAPIGFCGNFHYDPLPDNTREIGMLYVNKEYRGQGLAQRLFAACIARAEDDPSIACFLSGHRMGNTPSEKTILSMGFTPTHTARFTFSDGKEYDTQEYELLIR